MAHVNKGYHFDGDVVENGSNPKLEASNNAALLNKEHRISRLSTIIKLLVFLLLASVVAVIVIAVLYIEKDDDNDDGNGVSKGVIKPPSVCLTTNCLMSAAQVHSKINYDVDPCEDFYEFACGRWMEENELPDDSSALGMFAVVDKTVSRRIHAILEAEKNEDDPDYVNKAKDLYISCMDTDTVDKRGYEPMKKMLEEEFGSVPVLDPNWNESDFDLVSHMQRTFAIGQGVLFWIWIGPDIKKKAKNVIKIDQPTFGLPSREYYMVERNSSLLARYERMITDLAILLGANETIAREDAAAIVDLECELARITVPDSERRDGWQMYNEITLEDIHNDYIGVFDWKRFVKGLTEQLGVNPPVTDTERMLSYSPRFFANFMELLMKTPRRVIANYAIIQTASNYEYWLSEPFRRLHLEYDKLVYGKKAASMRSRVCMATVSNIIGLAVGQMYVQEHFDSEAKKEVLTMIHNLKDAFDELLDELDWMDEETKRSAREKNRHIVSSIGYPELILNNTYLEEKYANFNFSTVDLFNNMHMANKESLRVTFVNLRKDIDPREWFQPPHVVNAFYNSLKNKIMFPAGILNPPFFSFSYPRSMNFGAIGVVIGHEITHGFDDEGSQFDKDGIFTQWWNDEAIESFKTQKQCIIEQYGNFTAKQINKTVNGIITQGENIADNGGIRQSFRAYRNWVAAQGQEELPLPGLNFTHDQLFFLSFGQVWCEKWTDRALFNKILMGPHSPGRFRVIGSIQNSDGFAESFNCKAGSPMSREEKCRVW